MVQTAIPGVVPFVAADSTLVPLSIRVALVVLSYASPIAELLPLLISTLSRMTVGLPPLKRIRCPVVVPGVAILTA